uniref:Tubulin folding cofactor B n=1 Tax=Gadus morhua TaxID=8049 RepID=A0A8C5ARW7_GADMO
MDGGLTVITNPIVAVRLTSTLSSFEVNKKYSRGLCIADFKGKLEMVVGTPVSCMDLELYSTSDQFLVKMDDNDALLGSYPVDDDCRIHVVDRSGAKEGEFSDLSKVEKFTISDDAYAKKSDSVRSFMKKQRVGRFNEEEMAAKESEQVARDAKEEAAASAIPVGSRCQVQVPGQPTKIGAVMYVGKAVFSSMHFLHSRSDESKNV